MLPSNRIPLTLKLAYTAFMAVLVPIYWWAYGPTNFLYFCDVALFFTLAALWLESSLLASIPAVGILLPQALWCVDFLAMCVGCRITGMTAYMFNFKTNWELFTRGLSFFHFWLPWLLVYIIWRLGYDRRALLGWIALAWVLQLVAYFLLPAPPADYPNQPVNVNYVYGFSDEEAQTWMPEGLFLGLMMVALPVLFFIPAHFILAWLVGPPRPRGEAPESAIV